MSKVTVQRYPVGIAAGVFNDAAHLLGQIIDECEELQSSHEWRITPIQQTRSRSEARFKMCPCAEHHQIKVIIRPRQNDSTWEYVVTPPADVGHLIALRVLQLWDGWTGRGVAKSYAATLPAAVHHHVADHATKPAAAPAVALPPAHPAGDDALAVLQGLAETLATAGRMKAAIADLENKAAGHDDAAMKYMRMADEESAKAEDIREQVAAHKARLNDPKIVAAQSAIAGLQALLKGST